MHRIDIEYSLAQRYFSTAIHLFNLPSGNTTDTSGLKGSETKTGKMKNLQLFFFLIFCLLFWISETSRQYSVEKRRMLCNIVLKSLKGGPFGLCETPAGCKKNLKN